MVSLVLLYQDLRLQDHPALEAAYKRGAPTLILYVYDPKSCNLGAASRWWLHYSLEALNQDLKKEGSFLCLQKGNILTVVEQFISSHSVNQVYWSESREPGFSKVQENLKNLLKEKGCQYTTFNASYLFPLLVSPKGTPYQVFTPFWKACLKEAQPRKPLPKRIPPPYSRVIESCSLEELDLLPKKKWAEAFSKDWIPGEKGAEKALEVFLKTGLLKYETGREFPALKGSSRLSPHLHFGEISPFEVWHKTQASECYVRELGWREFASSFLYFFPYTETRSFKAEWDSFPWHARSDFLERWQKGQTGYPIVDAGMRELWQTGWMHNRVRMIVSSFLVKDLGIHWSKGAAWFWDTLLDADLASNVFGWQWSAGCGADAAPYFRIFNPILQGKKFDPEGIYVKRYIPELEHLPLKWIHSPWEAPKDVLEKSRVVLGQSYPKPIVDHQKARELALQLYEDFKNKCH